MRTLEAEVELEVEFHDVDAMEVAWHGHYVKYFERARMEHHPEAAGTIDEVRLTRLGTAVYTSAPAPRLAG